MVESEQLRDLTPETFYLLGKGNTVYTDDEIPMDEVLSSMREILAENTELYSQYKIRQH